jgi:hypothetical protein
MEKVPNISQLIKGKAERDAIHIAIAPVTAACDLNPGQDIGFIAHGNIDLVGINPTKSIGIVSPFLKKPVKRGQKFFMLLYPNTITSLRHDWTHPDFVQGTDSAKVSSQLWVNKYAQELSVDLEELMDAAERHIKHGDYWSQGGRFEGMYIDSEFWVHYEILKDTKVDDKEASFFSCSC